MPTFTHDLVLPRTPAETFEFFRNVKNRVQLLRPDAALALVDGPPRLELGSRTTWKLSRFGLSQSIVLEVTVCEPPTRLVEEQRQGPMRHWVQRLTCIAQDGGTLVQDVIEYQLPGGMMGLLVTANKIDEMLMESMAWRDQQLPLIFPDARPR